MCSFFHSRSLSFAFTSVVSVPVHSIHNECDISVRILLLVLLFIFNLKFVSFVFFLRTYLFEQTLWKSVCTALTQQMHQRRMAYTQCSSVQCRAVHTMCACLFVFMYAQTKLNLRMGIVEHAITLTRVQCIPKNGTLVAFY